MTSLLSRNLRSAAAEPKIETVSFLVVKVRQTLMAPALWEK
jgi:hypothetical protein